MGVQIEGTRVDTEATVDELCSKNKVSVAFFEPYCITYFEGRLERGGELPGQFQPGDRRALTLRHAAGYIVLHYPDAVVKFDGTPYAGHYGFQLARGGSPYIYHVLPTE